MQGDGSNSGAEDSSEKKYLNTLSVPEVLYLKLISMTMLKAFTLERINVDGDSIFRPGQMGVSIGRTTM